MNNDNFIETLAQLHTAAEKAQEALTELKESIADMIDEKIHELEEVIDAVNEAAEAGQAKEKPTDAIGELYSLFDACADMSRPVFFS